MKISIAYDNSRVDAVSSGRVKASFSKNECFVLDASDEYVLNINKRRINKESWIKFIKTVNKYYKLSIDSQAFDTSLLEN